MSGRTFFMVGVDTEADDQWTLEGRKRLSVENAKALPRLQALCDAFAVRPSYLVTHEMATREPSRSILRDLFATGRCEIGAHLHPWSSPPYREEDLVGRYPSQLDDSQLEVQLTDLTAAIETSIGVRPVSYRAGRHGFDSRSLRILERLQYRVDTSVDPLFNETRKGRAVIRGGSGFSLLARSRRRANEGAVDRSGDSRVVRHASRASQGFGAAIRVAARHPLARLLETSRPARGLAATLLFERGRREGARERPRRLGSADPQHAVPFERTRTLWIALQQDRRGRGSLLREARTGVRARHEADRSARRHVSRMRRSPASAALLKILMVTPHLPPYQAANALLPHVLGVELEKRGHDVFVPDLQDRGPAARAYRLRAAPFRAPSDPHPPASRSHGNATKGPSPDRGGGRGSRALEYLDEPGGGAPGLQAGQALRPHPLRHGDLASRRRESRLSRRSIETPVT